MSTLPDFTGPGFFAGEAPDGLTTIAGTPTSAQVRVYWRDPADPDAPDVLVDSTQSAADGTWQIAGLNPALRYVVRAQKSQFDDVTVVGAAPSRSDVIAYVDQLVPREDEFGNVDGLTGHVLLDSGLPPFTCQVIEPLPYGLTARVDGRKLLIEGVSTDNGLWESVVRVTASNGVWVDVPVQVQIQVVFDPHWGNVSLLLSMDGVNGSTTFIDSSPRPKLITAYGDAKISTAQSKWGGASFFTNGSSGSYASITNTSDFNFSGGEFTVEGFVWPLANGVIIGSWRGNVASDCAWLIDRNTSGKLGFSCGVGSTNGSFASSATLAIGVFSHFAVCRSASTLRFFINGVLDSSHTLSGALNYYAAEPVVIGAVSLSSDARGVARGSFYLDELRITKGVARYTENFTPPTRPFPSR